MLNLELAKEVHVSHLEDSCWGRGLISWETFSDRWRRLRLLLPGRHRWTRNSWHVQGGELTLPLHPCPALQEWESSLSLPSFAHLHYCWSSMITCPSRLLFNARWMNHLMLVKTFADPSILNVPLRIHSFVLLFDLSMNDQTLGLLGSSISWEQKTTHNPNSSSPSYDPHSQQIPWIFEMIPSERKWIHQFWSWKYTIFDIRISI